MAKQYVESVWAQVWGRGSAMNSESLLRDTATALRWDQTSFLDYVESSEAEEAYLSGTLRAHDRGVFGVPTMEIDEEMWWGNDRLDFMEEELARRLAPCAADTVQPA